MARLATAYLHLDIQQSPFDRGKFGEALGEIARSIAQEVYRSPIEITVQVEEGSTRVWITVFGVLYAVYGGVAKYPDFREGVRQVVADGRRVTGYINDRIIRDFARPDRVIRAERRTETPGQLQRLLDDLQE